MVAGLDTNRLVHQGFDVAHGLVPPRTDTPAEGDELDRREEEVVLTGSVGLAFSEDQDFDDLDDLGHRSGPADKTRQRRRPAMRASRRIRGYPPRLPAQGSQHLSG